MAAGAARTWYHRCGAALRAEAVYLVGSRWDRAVLLWLPLLSFVIAAAMFWHGSLRQIPVAFIDHEHSALSRGVSRALTADPRLRLVHLATDAEAAAALRKAQVLAVLPWPAGAERSLVRRTGLRLQIGFNAAYQTAASQGAAALQQDAQQVIRTVLVQRLGLAGLSAIALPGPRVQISQVGNPQVSFERFLEPLLLAGMFHLWLSCAVVGQVGRALKTPAGLAWALPQPWRMAGRLSARLAWPTMVFMLWFSLIPMWLHCVRGWPVNGHLWLWLLGQWALCAATATIGAVLVAATRDIDTAFSMSTIYAGSALAYSNGTLPVLHASGFTRGWSEALPFTHYLLIQNQQFVMGSDIRASLPALGYLVALSVLAGLLAVGLWVGIARRPPAGEKPVLCGPAPDQQHIGQACLATLVSLGRSRALLSLAVLSVLLYGFYYPEAYRSEVSVKLPVTVVDQDHSVWSRQLIRALAATRAIQVQHLSGDQAQALNDLRNGVVDGVVLIAPRLQASLQHGDSGGLGIFVSSAWLVRARDIGEAARAAIAAVAAEAAAPLLPLASVPPGAVKLELVPMYNRANGYAGYVVPAVASIILYQTLLFATAMLIALRREQARRWSLRPGGLLGCWLAMSLVGVLTGSFLYGFVFWFQDFPRMGQPLGLAVVLPLYVATIAALGLCLGSCFERGDRAIQVLAGTSLLLFFLAGVSWPLFAMPAWLQWLSGWLPSTLGTQALLQLSSDGASLAEVAAYSGRLLLLCGGCLLLAAWRLRDRGARIES